MASQQGLPSNLLPINMSDVGPSRYYTPTLEQSNRFLNQNIEKNDAGFLGIKAYSSIIEENFRNDFLIGRTIEKLGGEALNKIGPKLSPDELNKRYSAEGLIFKKPATEEYASYVFNNHITRKRLEEINANFSGNDWVNKALFVAPTIIGNLPAIAVEELVAASLAGPVGAALVLPAHILAASTKVFRGARYVNNVARVAQGTRYLSRAVTKSYPAFASKGAKLYFAEAAHEALYVNGLGSLLQGSSAKFVHGLSTEESVNIAKNQALLGAAFSFGIAGVRTGLVSKAFSGRLNSISDNHIKSVIAEKVDELEGTISDFIGEKVGQRLGEANPTYIKGRKGDLPAIEKDGTIQRVKVDSDAYPSFLEKTAAKNYTIEDINNISQIQSQAFRGEAHVNFSEPQLGYIDETLGEVDSKFQESIEGNRPLDATSLKKETLIDEDRPIEEVIEELTETANELSFKDSISSTSLTEHTNFGRELGRVVSEDPSYYEEAIQLLEKTLESLSGVDKNKASFSAFKGFAETSELKVDLEELAARLGIDGEYSGLGNSLVKTNVEAETNAPIFSELLSENTYIKQLSEQFNAAKPSERIAAIKLELDNLKKLEADNPDSKVYSSLIQEIKEQFKKEGDLVDEELAEFLNSKSDDDLALFISVLGDKESGGFIDNFIGCISEL